MSVRGVGYAQFTETATSHIDRMFRLNDGRYALIPLYDGLINILDLDGPGIPQTTKFGESSLEPFQTTVPTVVSVNSLSQLVVHSPSTNEVYRISYGQSPNTGSGPSLTAHFYWEVAVFDFTAETVTFTDYGIGPRHVPVGSWVTLFRQMYYGISFRGCADGKVFLGRFDASSSGTNYDCVVINTATQTASVLNNVYADGTENQAFAGQMLEANDGKLYGPGFNYSLVIDPAGPTFTTTTHGGLLPASNGFTGGLGSDSAGRIYATPTWSTGGDILVIDPAGTTLLTDLGLSPTTNLKYKSSAAQGADGLMTLLPRNGLASVPTPSGSNNSVVQFDPDTLVGDIVMTGDRIVAFDNSLNLDDAIVHGEMGFQHDAGGSRVYRWGFREQVGAESINPPERTNNSSGNVGIVCRRHKPLRPEPYIFYNTANWDGGWVLPNEGTAGPDLDLYIYVFEDFFVPGYFNITASYFDVGFTNAHSGGMLYGEPFTYMMVIGDLDASSVICSGSFQLTTGSPNFYGHAINFSSGFNPSIDLQIGGASGLLEVTTAPTNTLYTAIGDLQQGGGNFVIDETWYHNHVDSNIDSDISSNHAFIGLGGESPTATTDHNQSSFVMEGMISLPTPGLPWQYGLQQFAAFRGQALPSDIPGWKTLFGL